MEKTRQRNGKAGAVWFYAAGFVAAGALHLADRLTMLSMNGAAREGSAYPALLSTLLFTLNLSVYFFLLVRWFISLRTRLLPSRGRAYLSVSAVMMIFFLLDRAIKYRAAAYGTLLEHITWYAYYIPLAVIPTTFLLTCLGAAPETPRKKRSRLYAALFCALLLLAVATNDLHTLMFRPMGNREQGGTWGSYSTGPVWYVFYAYIVLCVIIGAILLAARDRREKSGRRALPTLIILIFMLAMMTLVDRFLPVSPWVFPEIAVFCMLGIFENCIETRLIPSNENYDLFFENISFPALITDRDLKTVFSTASGDSIPRERLSEALLSPLGLENGKVLYSKELSAGRVFFISDESEIRSLNEKLSDVAEALEGENDLLRFENRQKEERARIDARNAVYSKASKEVYGVQKRIAACLDKAESGEDHEKNTAKALLLSAYVKRKTNFVLCSSEREEFTARELFLALDESARFLTLCGIPASAEQKTEASFSYREVCALYDTFEALAEALPEDARAFAVTLCDGHIRCLADCGAFPLPRNTPAGITAQYEDGQLYLTISANEGGAR